MAVHSFSGVTAKITVSSSLVGFVSGDFSMAVATGKYIELDQVAATSHTRGLRSGSGSLKLAWGITDTTLYAMFNGGDVFNVTFDNDSPATGVAGAHQYTLTGCVFTDIAVEGVEAGAEGALMINASFEALNWSRVA